MDTAHPIAGAENTRAEQMQEAANAFKAFVSEQPVKAPEPVRDEHGRFASPEEQIAETEDEAGEPLAEAEVEATEEEETAQPAQPLPPSWPADQSEHWESLPPDTRAFLAEREGERERFLNAKSQDFANARKAADAELAEARTNRSQYKQMLDTLVGALQPQKPNPADYGYGTGQYHQEAYQLADYQYHQQMEAFAQLTQQRDAIGTQESQERDAESTKAREAMQAAIAEDAMAAYPKFVEVAPEFADPAKRASILDGVFQYAMNNGVPKQAFETDRVGDLPLSYILTYWKAQQYDALRSAQAAPAKPKPAGPAVRPGVSSPRSAQKAARTTAIRDRLASEGSIEAGAAMWKNLLSG